MSRKRVLTKSPKHKLKLIKEDGKSYIRKKDLDHYFFEQGMTREDFKFHFGIGHRIMTQSLYKYFKHIKVDAEVQFPLGSYKYDFFFPKFNLLLELDGSLHEINRDRVKDELAVKQGYKIIRIKLSKNLLHKAYDEQTIFKKIESCINQFQLFQ